MNNAKIPSLTRIPHHINAQMCNGLEAILQISQKWLATAGLEALYKAILQISQKWLATAGLEALYKAILQISQ